MENVEDPLSEFDELDYTPQPSWGKDLAAQIPSNATSIPVKQLGKVHGATVAWQTYTMGVLSSVEAKLSLLKFQMEQELNKARYLASQRDPAWKVEAQLVQSSAEYAEAKKQAQVLEAQLTALKGVVFGYTERAKYLSRELTRRGIEFDYSGRT